MSEQPSEQAERIRKALPELVRRLRRTGAGRDDLIRDPIRRIAGNPPLLHLLERLAELPDEDIVAIWHHLEGRSDEEIAELLEAVEPEIVAFRRETAMARLRQETAPPAVPGTYYNPPDPEKLILAMEAMDEEEEARALAREAVVDVMGKTIEQVPESLAQRMQELARGYTELEAILQNREAALPDTTRQKPGSRRFRRDLRRLRFQLERILMDRVYPRAAGRNVIRNRMRQDMVRFFTVMAEVAETAARTADEERRPYYRRIARRARDHLSGGERTAYRDRVELLRAVI